MILISLMVAVMVMHAGAPAGLAQVATPAPAGLPLATAPFGLGTIDLPASDEGIEAIFTALPETVAGEGKAPWAVDTDRTLVPYGAEEPGVGHPMMLGTISFGHGDFFPPVFTAGDYVTMALVTDDAGATAGGRGGDLAWIRAEIVVGAGGDRPGTPVSSATMYTLAWGHVDGGQIFTAIADTPERLEALVTAFVLSAGGSPAPSAPGSPPA